VKYFLSFITILTFPILSVEVKLKDLASINQPKEDQITGFGLVVGLSGSGDSKSIMAQDAMKNYLANMGIQPPAKWGDSKNIASVLVTISLPSSVRIGEKVDITVSSIGDAKSLEGGVLLQTPLKAANGETILVASGPITMGGRDSKSRGDSKAPKNVGIVYQGGIIEKQLDTKFLNSNSISIILPRKDYTVLNAIVNELKNSFQVTPKIESNTEIIVSIPSGQNPTEFISNIENLPITTESPSRIVINERTGTVVMGANIPIEEVAIARQGLSIQIEGKDKPGNKEKKPEIQSFMIKETTKVSDLVDSLNKVGASTKDIISILESLKRSGAIHAEVIIQ
jgi:flagellar P-ring protein precursor FlgI